MQIKLTEKVERVLRQFPETRNSDALLTIQIWKTYNDSQLITWKDWISKYIKLETVLDLPREDTVKRVRAKLQNEKGLYLPTSIEVRKKRRINEESWHNWSMDSKRY